MAKFIEASDAGFTSGASVGAFKGAVKNLSNKAYHDLSSYWSSTTLKYMYANSPAHFRAMYFDGLKEKSEPTNAMLLGSLVHCMTLTPDEFQNEFFIMPDLNFRTNEGKAAKQELLALNAGKSPVTDEQVTKAHRIRESVMSNKMAKMLLEPLHKEAAFFWTCPFSNLNFRAKIDACGSSHFIELKTTSAASPENFQRHAYNMNYDLSLIHYRQALTHVMGVEPKCYFIVVETEAPYVCQVYEAGDSMLQTGHEKWLSAVTKLERSIVSKDWQGYFPDSETPVLESPSWAVNKLLKEEIT